MRKLLVLLMALAAPVAADAAEYTILIFEPPGETALRDAAGPESAAYWSDFAAYGKAMTDAGVLRGGAALDPQPARGAAAPSGYFVIDTPTLEAARDWAAKAPANRRGGRAYAAAHVAMRP